MKKKLVVVAMLIGICVASMQAQAQTQSSANQEKQEQKFKLTGGAILETNLSGFIHSGIGDGNSKMKFGMSSGGFVNLGISKSFSVQGEMLFHYKTSDFSWDNQTGSFRYWGVEIPIYMMYHYTFSKGNRIHIGVGPYTDFGLGARFEVGGKRLDVYEKEENTGLPIMRDSNTGFGVKVGYEFVSGLQINATYKVSATNILDANSSTVKMHPHVASLGVAYRFGK